jgi:hypothetical protein
MIGPRVLREYAKFIEFKLIFSGKAAAEPAQRVFLGIFAMSVTSVAF